MVPRASSDSLAIIQYERRLLGYWAKVLLRFDVNERPLTSIIQLDTRLSSGYTSKPGLLLSDYVAIQLFCQGNVL